MGAARKYLTALWPFRHLGLKALSVALAVLLWMVVAGEETVERGIRIPLELQQFPPGLELRGEPPSTVDVRVRGQSGTLSRLTPADLVAVLDLKGAQPGQRLLHVTPEQVRVPFGVEIVQVTPSTVALVLEKSGSKFVRVVPAVEGKPAPLERAVHNLAVHLRNLAPHLIARSMPSAVDVRVRGSQENLAGLGADSITAFVDLAGLGAGSYSLAVRADTTREAGITRIEPDSVQVRIVGSTD